MHKTSVTIIIEQFSSWRILRHVPTVLQLPLEMTSSFELSQSLEIARQYQGSELSPSMLRQACRKFWKKLGLVFIQAQYQGEVAGKDPLPVLCLMLKRCGRSACNKNDEKNIFDWLKSDSICHLPAAGSRNVFFPITRLFTALSNCHSTGIEIGILQISM